MALLEVSDLKVHFQTDDGIVKAVDGVSYTVERGRALGIVGESGSGKSVSSLTVMGLTRFAGNAQISGSIVLDGQDVLNASDEELRRLRGNDVAMIFQDPLSSLHPFYRVGDQLVEAVQAHHDHVSKAQALDRAVEMLGLVGIPEPRQRVEAYPHEFSGGMRQRVMIAMALINEPKLLIADEPTTALDVTVQAQILELIQRLQSELDTAIVMITHDLGVVAEVADEIAVMYAGRIVEHAPKDTIFAAPEHPYTWGLLKSIPRLGSSRATRRSCRSPAARRRSSSRRPGAASTRAARTCARATSASTPSSRRPASDGHRVACLLPPQTRRALWAELSRGATPEQARERVGIPEAAERRRAGGAAVSDALDRGPRPRQALPDQRGDHLPAPGRRGPGRRRRQLRRPARARRSASSASRAAASRRRRA